MEVAWVPACAGMTEKDGGVMDGGRNDGELRMTGERCGAAIGEGVAWAIGARYGRRWLLAVSHPPLNLPPLRGEG